jgi:hypothetical protein
MPFVLCEKTTNVNKTHQFISGIGTAILESLNNWINEAFKTFLHFVLLFFYNYFNENIIFQPLEDFVPSGAGHSRRGDGHPPHQVQRDQVRESPPINEALSPSKSSQ